MTGLPRSAMKFFWWLRRLLYLWVRTKVVPSANIPQELGLDPTKPVCYVIQNHSLSDLLVLDETCRRQRLPRPRHKPKALGQPGSASYIYLRRIGIYSVSRKSSKEPPSPLMTLVERAEKDKSLEVQLVPVAVHWGRNPGKEERSLFKLLFFDDEHAGVLQKFFIVLAQGRASFIHFGKPISLREQVDEGLGAEQTAKKLRRVLRVHFQRQRTAAMGPSLPSRSAVVASLMTSGPIRQAIQEEARKKGISLERAEARARSYLMEISADTKYSVVRFFDIFLTYVWNKIFDGVVVRHVERVRQLAESCELVYMPSHRSHMDYLLLAYTLYYQGLVPPHTAAGVNLNFWPVGALLRRAGAFYIRRSFSGNRLYATVFNEYVHYLLTKGHALKFYPEGGRSRTGRLLPPKTGMLSMVVQSYFRDPRRPIALVPVYLGYDKVMEVATYLKELRGSAKRQESLGQVVRLRHIFKSYFGRAYIGFGEPIMLEDVLAARHPNWREEAQEAHGKPTWLNPFVNDVARQVLTRINSSAVVSPTAIVSLVLLSSPARAMAEDELLYLMDRFVGALRATPYGPDVVLPEGTGKDFLTIAEKVARIGRFPHPGGDVIYLDEGDAVIMTYYRNNILHLVALPSLIASFLQHEDRIRRDELVRGAAQLYPFLKTEFFLPWDDAKSEKVIENTLEALVSVGLLSFEDEWVKRPDFQHKDFTATKLLGRALGRTLERYSIVAALLARHAATVAPGQRARVERSEFENQCRLMAQRIALLAGSKDLEVFDKSGFGGLIDMLTHLGYLEEDAGHLVILDRVREFSAGSLSLLSADIRQSIHRVAELPHSPNGA